MMRQLSATAKSRCLVGLGSFLLFQTVFAAPKDEGDKLILAGERIGQVRLNMDSAKLEALLGKPTTSDQAMGRSSETWCSKSVDGQMQQTIIYLQAADENRRSWAVTKVVITSPFFRTPASVSTRSEPVAMWQEFPDLQYIETAKTKEQVSVELYASVANGIGFVFERNPNPAPGIAWGKCRAVVVFPRGERIGAPYLGDCEPVR